MKKNLLVLLFFLVIHAASIAQPSEYVIKIKRTSENDRSTTGELYLNDKFISHTLELPWNNNRSYISSIPAKEYGGFIRFDKNGEYGVQYWRIELTETEPRTVIQIHRGTVPADVKGCIIVGDHVINHENKLADSEKAFERLKSLFPNYSPAEPLGIKVIIEYGIAYTKFNFDGGSSSLLTYTNQNGRWNVWGVISKKEYLRDLNYIYFEDFSMGADKHKYFRIPLFGGDSETSASASGPWKKQGWSNLIRVN